MKKSLLFLTFICLGAFLNAQVSFLVQDPSPNVGGYEISVADGADWGSPDMTLPENVVSGTMCLAEDSLACEALTNGPDLVDKIAVVYRGECEFGTKALNAQNEGAIAVIIINHSPGVIPMGGGDNGAAVTIPVIMIGAGEGAILYEEIAACNSTAIIGNLNGFFENNLRLTAGTSLRASSYARPHLVSLNQDEFDVASGAWIFNFGQNEETNAVLNVNVSLDGSELANFDADPVTIPAGDSVFVSMPTFVQDAYDAGHYDMVYTVTGTGDDGFVTDNMLEVDFVLADALSYARVDENGDAWPTNYTSPAETTGLQNICIAFQDPNASRLEFKSMTFSGTHFTETIQDMEIELSIMEWEGEELIPNDGTVDAIEIEGYTFQEGEDDAIITMEFDPVELEDDVRYLFCVSHENEDLQLGYDNKTDYTENFNTFSSVISPFWDEAEGFVNMFGPDLTVAISAKFDEANSIDEFENEVDITPFPNPANEMITIPFRNDMRGQAVLNIFNLQGKVVNSQMLNVSTNQLEVNVSDLANGQYLFNLKFENNMTSSFNVVVNR